VIIFELFTTFYLKLSLVSLSQPPKIAREDANFSILKFIFETVNSKFQNVKFTIFQKSPLRLKNDLHHRAVQSFKLLKAPKMVIFWLFFDQKVKPNLGMIGNCRLLDNPIMALYVKTKRRPSTLSPFIFSSPLWNRSSKKKPFSKNHSGPPVADLKPHFHRQPQSQ